MLGAMSGIASASCLKRRGPPSSASTMQQAPAIADPFERGFERRRLAPFGGSSHGFDGRCAIRGLSRS